MSWERAERVDSEKVEGVTLRVISRNVELRDGVTWSQTRVRRNRISQYSKYKHEISTAMKNGPMIQK